MTDSWQEFDAWCCINNVDPLDLPAYRFYNLALFKLREGMELEQLVQLELTLERCDSIKNPLQDYRIPKYDKKSKTDSKQSQPLPSSPRPESRHTYVPPWWRGEDANARVALTTMDNLPK